MSNTKTTTAENLKLELVAPAPLTTEPPPEPETVEARLAKARDIYLAARDAFVAEVQAADLADSLALLAAESVVARLKPRLAALREIAAEIRRRPYHRLAPLPDGRMFDSHKFDLLDPLLDLGRPMHRRDRRMGTVERAPAKPRTR